MNSFKALIMFVEKVRWVEKGKREREDEMRLVFVFTEEKRK